MATVVAIPRRPRLGNAVEQSGRVYMTTGRDRDVGRCVSDLTVADGPIGLYGRIRALLVVAESCGLVGDGTGRAAALAEIAALCVLLCAEAMLPPPAAPCPPPDGLTAREAEVLRHIAAGESNRAMATRLTVSVRTVERHIENLYRKIDAHTKAEATAYACRHHLA